MFKWRAIREHFKIMNPYIVFGFIVFFAGVFVGATNTSFAHFLEQQLASLGNVAETLDQSENPTMSYIIFIFLNNAIKSIFIIYLGALFGILPLLFLLINGMVIGFLLQHIAATQGTGEMLAVVFKGLLPHGIIEIPAIIIACAYGMKFGVLVLKRIGAAFIPGEKKKTAGGEIEYFMVRTVPVIVILTISLLVASIIESTVSVWLLSL